jgi:hypothetical protein
MDNRIRRVLDSWWEERREELLARILNANIEDETADETQGNQTYEPLAHPFFETVSLHRSSNDLGMNLLQFSIANILNMFPEVPTLPNPVSETEIQEVMREQPRRANFFSSFSIPQSLEWEIVTNGSLPVKRIDTADQECSICLDSIRKDTHVFSLVCGHIFHCQCICRVLCEPITPKCPLCRCNIEFTH